MDPFEAIDGTAGPTGSPIIAGCVAWIDCSIEAIHEAGAHYIVVGAVEAMGEGTSGNEPLLFLGGASGSFGTLPEN